MKATQFVGYKEKYEIREVPVPKIGDNDIFMKIGAAGFCHTDYQLAPKHETSRRLASALVPFSSSINATHVFHVRLPMTFVRFCENKGMAGLTNDGGMAEYMVSDAESAVLLPESISFEQLAPLICAGATVWGGIEAAKLTHLSSSELWGSGAWVLLGPLGLQFANILGYRVVAIAQSLTLKAELVVDFNDNEAAEKIKSWAGNSSLAAVVMCTDDIPAILWSTKTLRTRGIVINTGLTIKPIQFDSFDVVFQEKTVKGTLVASISQIVEMLKIVDKFEIRSHLTTGPLDKVPELPDMYMDPHLKGRLVHERYQLSVCLQTSDLSYWLVDGGSRRFPSMTNVVYGRTTAPNYLQVY